MVSFYCCRSQCGYSKSIAAVYSPGLCVTSKAAGFLSCEACIDGALLSFNVMNNVTRWYRTPAARSSGIMCSHSSQTLASSVQEHGRPLLRFPAFRQAVTMYSEVIHGLHAPCDSPVAHLEQYAAAAFTGHIAL